MTFAIDFTTKAKIQLEKLTDREQILKKIYSIRENPISYLKKLKGSKLWRLRIGKYRVIIDVIVKGNRLIVLRIGKRDGVY